MTVSSAFRTILFLSIGLLALTALANVALADTASLSTSLSQNVSISLSASSLTTKGIPGTLNESDTFTLTIVNEGSTNMSTIHVWSDVLSSMDENPVGGREASSYAAASFLLVGPGPNASHHYVGRLIWNNSENAGGRPYGLETPEDNPQAWGFYETAEDRYLWSLSGNGSTTTGSYCNQPALSSGTNSSLTTDHPVLVMSNEPDNGQNRNLSRNSTLYTFTDATGPWAVMRAERGPLDGEYVAAHRSCEKLYIYRYDGRGRFPFSTADDHHLFDGALRPNSSITVSYRWEIPPGIPAGETSPSELYIVPR